MTGFEQNKSVLLGKRLFLVCGKSFDKLEISKYINDLKPFRFSGFTPNPKIEEVQAGLKLFNTSVFDAILAIGGGSALDVAKCIKYYSKSNIELIAIPTTAGTGSESTHFAVVYKDGIKQSVADKTLLPDIVILEPSVLKNVPDYTRKSTMLDALCHAIESWWSVKHTPKSRALSEHAIELIMNNKNAYLANIDSANHEMLKAANLAGQAINITTTTAAHAMCYKLTSMYKLQHGHAAAICLPQVWNYIEACPGITKKDFVSLLKELDISYPVSSNRESDLDILADSVNVERLSNSPVLFDRGTLRSMYGEIVK
ncbi:MAG: phosphonoacetaldehyde reductase [Eubacteriales bacterium]|nr:phosphonoacetaldehyde reductase [Eubacteriales bacterium]